MIKSNVHPDIARLAYDWQCVMTKLAADFRLVEDLSEEINRLVDAHTQASCQYKKQADYVGGGSL